jgi:hypothetical protein
MRTWIAYWFSRFLPLKCLHDRDHSVANLKSPTFGLLKQLEAFLFLVEMVSLFYAGGARLGGSQGLYSSLGCGVSCHTEILASYRKIWEAVKDDGGRLSSTAE